MAVSDSVSVDITDAEPWTKPIYAWYVVGVLMLALMFSFIDRTILSLLVSPLRADLALSDTEISLLMGMAFALFYTVCGVPIARLADRRSRRGIIAVGITIWSTMTAVCGLAGNFIQLFIARLGVGVGEAALTPSSFSIIADNFPRNKLPRALALFHFGPAIGTGVSMIVGGLFVSWTQRNLPHVIDLPIIGTIFSWQLTFFLVGLPGLAIVVLLLLTVKEPKRRGVLKGQSQKMPLPEVVKFWRLNWRTFASHHVGAALKGLLAYGTSMWIPTFFIRTFGWTVAQAGIRYGLNNVIVAPIGLVIGGYIASHLDSKGYNDAFMRLVFILSVILIPVAIIFPLVSSPWVAFGLIMCRTLIGGMGAGPGSAALQVVTPNQMRAQISAIYMMTINFIAYGMGPTVIATITDFVFHDDAKLNYSLSLAAVILGPISSLILWYGVRHYGESVERARAWASSPVPAE